MSPKAVSAMLNATKTAFRLPVRRNASQPPPARSGVDHACVGIEQREPCAWGRSRAKPDDPAENRGNGGADPGYAQGALAAARADVGADHRDRPVILEARARPFEASFARASPERALATATETSGSHIRHEGEHLLVEVRKAIEAGVGR